jgi:biopolymer transport protein ExbD
MRRPSPYRDSQERLDVKMTPMIDVIFLLLVFFVATASFRAIEEVLPTRFTLPGTVSSQVQIDPEIVDLDEIVIDVLWRGDQPRWEVVGVEYGSLAELGAVLRRTREIKSDLPVILDVEPPVPMEHVIDVYDLCRAVGLERIQFAASG